MGLTKSLVEITHDEGYGDDLLLHINNAFRQKDMRADRIVTAKEPLVEKATGKYRKKPVLIDAWLWDETKETYAILEEAGMPGNSHSSHNTENWVRHLRISTRLGVMSVGKGDWIIKDSEGIFSICTPEVFEAAYEAAP